MTRNKLARMSQKYSKCHVKRGIKRVKPVQSIPQACRLLIPMPAVCLSPSQQHYKKIKLEGDSRCSQLGIRTRNIYSRLMHKNMPLTNAQTDLA